MTDKEILYKSFKIAEAGGYKNVNFNHPMSRQQSDNIIKYYWIRAFIFDHDFAKAFFEAVGSLKANYGWRVQLQTLVLEKEPLKYLEKFL